MLRDGWSRAAGNVAARLGLPRPALLRLGMNGVYRSGPAIIRVTDSVPRARAQLGVLTQLRANGFPVPVAVDDRIHEENAAAVTVWRFFDHDPSGEPPWEAVGAACRRLHALDHGVIGDAATLPQPSSFPWLRIDELLPQLLAEERTVLLGHWERVADWPQRLTGAPRVVCHGDLHPGNILHRRDAWLWIDWDQICLAPAAFDHAPLITWGTRWGGAADTYRRFAAGYGADLSPDPLARLLAVVRNLAATANMCVRGRTDPACAIEAARRLRFWRGEPDAPAWTAQ
jgi:aminoglycoside phosphotransferase (APT) family kinase protein